MYVYGLISIKVCSARRLIPIVDSDLMCFETHNYLYTCTVYKDALSPIYEMGALYPIKDNHLVRMPELMQLTVVVTKSS